MKEDGQLKKYLYRSLAGAGSIIICILVFFAIFRFDRIIAFYNVMMGILKPFVYGAVIAYLLTPICNFIERRLQPFLEKQLKNPKKAHSIAGGVGIGLSMIFGLLVIYLLIAMVMPQVFTSISSIVTSFPSMVNKWYAWIQNYLRDNETVMNYANEFINSVYTNVEDWLKIKLLPNMQTIVTSLSAGLVNVMLVLKNILIGLIAALYMMGNRRKFAAQAKKLIYSIFKRPHANAILKECRLIDRMFGGFISGKLIDSLIIGCLCFFLMSILKLPYVMLISVVVGVTNIIPFFGPYIGAIPSAILVLTVNPMQCVYFLIMILVLQQFDGNFLGPKILGNSTGLSSFWVLFSILVFGGLLGFVGMIIGVPAFAVIYDLVKKSSNYLLRQKKLSTDTGVYQELVSIEEEGAELHYVQNHEISDMETETKTETKTTKEEEKP